MSSSRIDPQPPARDSRAMAGDRDLDLDLDDVDIEPDIDDIDFLAIIARAESVSKDYQSRTVDRPLARSYRAWQNQHAEGSKYLGPDFRGRSRLFVPKTRAAVRKNLAAAAGALFSTEDVTSIAATHEDDPQQRATASVIKADLEYRLTRTSMTSGMPWFLIAMGACLDSQLTGCCFSKQYWEFEEVPTGEVEDVEDPLIDEMTGELVLDDMGVPVVTVSQQPVMRAVKDRPMVELFPIENIGIDPAAPWHSVVQGGRWFYARYPTGISDARAMMRASRMRGESIWLPDISDATLRKGRLDDERNGARRVREGGGSDRYEETNRAGGELDIIWLQENFVRIGGKDYTFWSVGRHAIISKIRETVDAYPEFGGERPYKMGFSQLDTHRPFPQSPVSTWEPLQLEINDITNLRLDTLKRSIAPLTLAKRGKNVDIQALQRRGQPETVVLLENMDDVNIVATPGPNGAAFQETSVTNANFDELAGVFSTSSVQTSRQLNETVGGMSLMSRAANSVSEFDLRIWIETWVEPVLRDLVHLVRYHESDERILAIAGQQARVWSRYQYMPSLSDFEQCDLTVRVNAGIGAADPIQKLQKLKFAMEMLAPLMPAAKAKGITPNIEALIEEVMGTAGFRDGRRFFEFGDPEQEQPDPMLMIKKMEADTKAARQKAEAEKWANDFKAKLASIQSAERQSAADNDALISSSEIEWQGRLAQHIMGSASADMRQASALRQKEADSMARYRMQQLGQQPAQQNVANVETSDAMLPGIGQMLDQLIRVVGDLQSKVNAQAAVINKVFGGVASLSQEAVMQ